MSYPYQKVKEWRANNPEKWAAQRDRRQRKVGKTAHELHRRVLATTRWRNKGNNREKHFWYGQKVRYGITKEWYEKKLAEQGGGCAMCGKPPEDRPRHRHLNVDHDHRCCPGRKSCGKCLRGLLCFKCNWLLGFVEKNDAFIIKAGRYLMGPW